MKVLIVDDHPLILWALKTMVEKLQPDAQITELVSGQRARELLEFDPSFDLLLLDLELPDADGFELLTEFRSLYEDITTVVISASERPSDVVQALDLGAMGFMPKRMSTAELTKGLSMVLSGAVFVPPTVVDILPDGSVDDSGYQTVGGFEDMGLTPRQADVLTMLLQGKPNKDIARRLNLSVETIKDHVAAVLRALGVSSRTQAVLAVADLQKKRRLEQAKATNAANGGSGGLRVVQSGR